jgi:hypothetical protein
MKGCLKLLAACIIIGSICTVQGIDMPGEMYSVSGSEAASSGDLSQYQEYYTLDQAGQSQTGPVQYMVAGSEPESLVVSGQSRPYDPGYIPLNSFWIQGSRSWTQYIKCPMYATFRMLAFSNGGPTTVVERYPDGYQSINYYSFYNGYTRLIFEADAVGRHTLTFYSNGQASNDVVVDVVPGGPYYGSGYQGETGYISGSGYSSRSSSSQVVIHSGGSYSSYQSQQGWSTQPGYAGSDGQIVVKETYI